MDVWASISGTSRKDIGEDMAREILFRGRTRDGKKCFCGDLVQNGGLIRIWEKDDSNGMWVVDPDTVGQYTGPTDKNSRKIFEGDIIPDHFDRSTIGVVRYGGYRNPFNDDEHGGHMGFYVDWGDKKDRLRADLGYWVRVSEVIGDIFDDPGLIGRGGAAG